jgi:hypothetical protein
MYNPEKFQFTEEQIWKIIDKVVPLIAKPEDEEFFRALLYFRAKESPNFSEYTYFITKLLKEAKTMIVTLDYRLPTHWASALVNDDYSGLTEEDERELKTFLDMLPDGYHPTATIEDLGFCHSNDAGTLACDCSLYTFMKNV